MPYTPDEIMALAEETYLNGFEPEAGAWYMSQQRICLLTAACIAAGKKRPGCGSDAAKYLGQSEGWVAGCTDGFDGHPCVQADGMYRAGHRFGQAARRKFLENVPAEVVPQQQTACV
jgi:hypothetical protein